MGRVYLHLALTLLNNISCRLCKTSLYPAYNWLWRRHDAVRSVVTYQEYRDGVGPSPKGGSDSTPSKSATGLVIQLVESTCHGCCVAFLLPKGKSEYTQVHTQSPITCVAVMIDYEQT